MKTKIAIVAMSLWLAACAEDGPHKAIDGADGGGAQKATGGAVPGFAQASAVLDKYCVKCHQSGKVIQWADYATAKSYADNGLLVRRVVTEKSMPQIGSAEAGAITAADRQLLGAWAAGGAPKEPGVAPASAVAGKPSADEGGVAAVAAPAAIQSCTSCHGMPNAGPGDKTVPRLSGQREEYMITQLNAFARNERIHLNGPMNKIAAEMTGEQIAAAARAYATGASLNLENPDPERARMLQARRGEEVAVESCSMCHANQFKGGQTNHPLIPALAGQNERYLRDQLNAYRSGWRKNNAMQGYANKLDDADLDAVAYYFSIIRINAPSAH